MSAAADSIWRRLRSRLWPDEWWRRGAAIVLAVLLPVLALDALFPPPLHKGANVSYAVMDRRGAMLRVFAVGEGTWRLKADLDRIDPQFVEALLAYEDKRFFSHDGVDALALGRAAMSFASAGRIVSGGSTITMQTARLLEPKPRTLGAKLIESVRAWQIERRLSKTEILELYLTLAPYGGNLEGVRAASWAYFGREPDNLSPAQIAMLIALPQSPEARRPDLRPEAAVIARKRVLDRLAAQGVVAADLAAESAEYPAPKRGDFPALAWHAAEEAARRAPARGDVVTTIDLALQRDLERIATAAAAESDPGVQISILAVELKDRQVRGAVGSAKRDGAGGWIDLTHRKRSPGSTLKPFIYGIAFDDGVASSRTRIADAPRRFSSYRPDNFDRMFRGDVTVAEALQHSLNVPAVSALDAVGARRFAAQLSFAGAALALPVDAEEDAGLAIALGGAGLSVRELAVLYAALGDGGRAFPLAWLKSEVDAAKADPPRPVPVMSEDSAREIVRILANAPTPSGRMPARLTQNAPVIAFKTGTSYGFRDAWAAGVGGGYAIVVWMGRPDGAPRPGVTGREAALPLLFDAFDSVARVTPARSTGPERRDEEPVDRTPPQPLARFERENQPPHILFPPHNSEVWSDEDHSSFVLAAEGHGRLAWYVDGEPLQRNPAGDPVWRPAQPGFYDVSVVDPQGRTARSQVRVRTPGG